MLSSFTPSDCFQRQLGWFACWLSIDVFEGHQLSMKSLNTNLICKTTDRLSATTNCHIAIAFQVHRHRGSAIPLYKQKTSVSHHVGNLLCNIPTPLPRRQAYLWRSRKHVRKLITESRQSLGCGRRRRQCQSSDRPCTD